MPNSSDASGAPQALVAAANKLRSAQVHEVELAPCAAPLNPPLGQAAQVPEDRIDLVNRDQPRRLLDVTQVSPGDVLGGDLAQADPAAPGFLDQLGAGMVTDQRVEGGG